MTTYTLTLTLDAKEVEDAEIFRVHHDYPDTPAGRAASLARQARLGISQTASKLRNQAKKKQVLAGILPTSAIEPRLPTGSADLRANVAQALHNERKR